MAEQLEEDDAKQAPSFPGLELLHQIFRDLSDALPDRTAGQPAAENQSAASSGEEDDSDDGIEAARTVMNFFREANEDVLKRLPVDQCRTIRQDLQRLFDQLISTRRESTSEFYSFWRGLVLKLITSYSIQLQLFGWEQLDELIEACAKHRPPPKSLLVAGAGKNLVNGPYEFAGNCSLDGYAPPGVELLYERKVPAETEKDQIAKTFRIYRKQTNGQNMWFLSEANERCGTDQQVTDLYKQQPSENECIPPSTGWVACHNDRDETFPKLQARGLVVPVGEEFNTFEHQLAKWAIENNILERLFGSFMHVEIVPRSKGLIKFLAWMCERDAPEETAIAGIQPNQFCLTSNHLLMAWRSRGTADAAVCAQLYQLLVSALPFCPNNVSIPLLKEIRSLLQQGERGAGHVEDVANFCSAFASANPVDTQPVAAMTLPEKARVEVQELLWAVLAHPKASGLRCFDSLKKYAMDKLGTEAKGSKDRLKVVKMCINSIKKSCNMVVDEPSQLHPKPYVWADAAPPSANAFQLWEAVAKGLDSTQTVGWKMAVGSLEEANANLRSSEDARTFVETYMTTIIGILVEQRPTDIGPYERDCIRESLSLALGIVAKDIEIQLSRSGESIVLNTLSLVFDKKKRYFKARPNSDGVAAGLPELRVAMIQNFREKKGFALLRDYMMERLKTPIFPTLEVLHPILQALGDSLPNRTDNSQTRNQKEEDAMGIAGVVMNFISESTEDQLNQLLNDHLRMVRNDLQQIFDKLISSRRTSTSEFYSFWKALVLRLISSEHLQTQLFGWEQLDSLIGACSAFRYPPKAYLVTGAGCNFVNGLYKFAADRTKDGYALPKKECVYKRDIPSTDEEGAGKKLTLFRCTMRSKHRWWFLSEADEEQPGTDRDIDYYQYKSDGIDDLLPPSTGWVTCRNAGVNPPPKLQARGLMVPPGEEFNTFEHQLAKWAIENKLLERVFGDSIHVDIVPRSKELIKFLASMCERDPSDWPAIAGTQPNQFCLTSDHLLLAWRTCIRKGDVAICSQVNRLLVSVLPDCPSAVSIPLLKEIRSMVQQGEGGDDHVEDVANFCSAFVSANPVGSQPSTAMIFIPEDIIGELLDMFWAAIPRLASGFSRRLKRYSDELKGLQWEGNKRRKIEH